MRTVAFAYKPKSSKANPCLSEAVFSSYKELYRFPPLGVSGGGEKWKNPQKAARIEEIA